MSGKAEREVGTTTTAVFEVQLQMWSELHVDSFLQIWEKHPSILCHTDNSDRELVYMEAANLPSLAVFQGELLSHRLISKLIHYNHFNGIMVL